MKTFILFITLLGLCLSDAFAGQTVNLAWDANTEPDVSGYRLYFGTSSRVYSQTVDVGNTTAATVSNLTAGTRYYFAVKAHKQGLESQPSDEVFFDATPNPNPNQPMAVIGGFQFLPDGSAQIEVGGYRSGLDLPGGIDVEASSDLVNWTVLAHLSAPFQAVTLVDPAADGAPQRFYRLRPR